jgi:CDP-glucose 4,6-dehydratase
VLESVAGYLQLGAKLMASEPAAAAQFCEAWNFGPTVESVWSVRQVVDRLVTLWGNASWRDCSDAGAPHEAKWLALSSEKAFHRLQWKSVWDVDTALIKTVAWTASWAGGSDDMRAVTERQIGEYVADAAAAGASWAADLGTRNPE